MKLPFRLGKKETPSYFLALLLRDEKANAVIFEELAGKARVVGEHEEYFPDTIESASEEQWLETLDKAISIAETNLPEGVETQKAIFGVKENWVEDSKIKKEYLLKLKKASDELGLSPIGFLVIHEAIAHTLQLEEGAPVSAILTEVDKKQIAVSIVRGGKVLETERAAIEGSIPKITDKLLHRFTSYDVLPSRVIIFDGKEDERLSQEFISHSWSKSLPFLHVPQVKILPRGFDAKAILFGAASQMGFEILDQDTTLMQAEDSPEKEEEKKSVQTEKEAEVELELDEKTEEPAEKEEETDLSETFGFKKGIDVAKEERPPAEKTVVEEPTPHRALHQKETKTQAKPNNEKIENLLSAVGLLFSSLSKIPRFPSFSLSLPFSGKKLLIPVLLLGLAGILFILYLTSTKATVTLLVTPKGVGKDQEIVFSQSADTNFDKGIIKINPITVTEDGKLSAQATGKKSVGDKAKGTVTIFNSADAKRQLTAGTVITSSNNLEFTLDKDVAIASASGDIFSGTKPGTAQALVTAKNIGTESNLPSNTKFSVSESTTLAAKNDSAFSGGTKKDITVVSKTDIDKLTEEFPKTLQQKAKDDLKNKVPGGQQLLPVFLANDYEKKTLDKKVDEEASTVTLSGSVTFTAASFASETMQQFAKNVLKNDIEGMSLGKDGVKFSIRDSKINKEKDLQATVHITAAPIPSYDTKKITTDISGKSFKDATSYLTSLPQVKDAVITPSPNLPFLPKTLPRIADNISLRVENRE